MSLTLVINPGSTSKKFGLFEDNKQLAEAYFESGKNFYSFSFKFESQKIEKEIEEGEFKNAHEFFISTALKHKIINSTNEVQDVGIRIVAPGSFFLDHHQITTDVFEKIKQSQSLAPLHLTPAINEIESIYDSNSEASIYAISDSAFHKTIAETQYLYGIDYQDSSDYDIRKFGYHGISVSSVVRKVKEKLGHIPNKMIVAHLGGGCSITAVKEGKSFDTSMGFTPLEGLIMASRPGDIDAGAILQLIRDKELDYDQIEHYLNKNSGLNGISRITGDMKSLLDLCEQNDEAAKRAVNLFVYRVKKYIGSYVTALGGVDMLIFTATIGERSDIIRRMICTDLDASLGLAFDPDKNSQLNDNDGYISPFGSEKDIVVIPTNELGQMAFEVQKMATKTAERD